MIVLNEIEISKNTVAVQEVFIIKITVSEVMAKWNDVKNLNYLDIKLITYDNVKRKIF